jgi:hypothetical protein
MRFFAYSSMRHISLFFNCKTLPINKLQFGFSQLKCVSKFFHSACLFGDKYVSEIQFLCMYSLFFISCRIDGFLKL